MTILCSESHIVNSYEDILLACKYVCEWNGGDVGSDILAEPVEQFH